VNTLFQSLPLLLFLQACPLPRPCTARKLVDTRSFIAVARDLGLSATPHHVLDNCHMSQSVLDNSCPRKLSAFPGLCFITPQTKAPLWRGHPRKTSIVGSTVVISFRELDAVYSHFNLTNALLTTSRTVAVLYAHSHFNNTPPSTLC
jgi:hypothetical protein